MKLHRTIYNVEIALAYFYSHIFHIKNYNFVNLSLSVPQHEKDEFKLTELPLSNVDYYTQGYKLLLKLVLGETDRDAEIARKRYPYIYVVTKTVHAIFIFGVLKLFYIFLCRLF